MMVQSEERLVSVPPPFDFPAVLAAARRGEEDPLNRQVEGRWRRLMGGVLLEAEPAPGGLLLRALAGRPDWADLLPRVVRLFGLDQDPADLLCHPAVGPRLGHLFRRLAGFRATGYASPYEALVMAILAQQISLTVANALRARLVRSLGDAVHHGGETYWGFPPPERLAGADLRPLGVSAAKERAIRAVAAAFARGELTEEELHRLPDEAVIARVTALPGIGRWTAEWLLLRGMGRCHVVPAGDLGVQKALAFCLGLPRRPGEAEVRQLTRDWHPVGGIVIHYLLRALKDGIP